MKKEKDSYIKPAVVALIIGSCYIVLGILYIYFTTDWTHDAAKSLEHFANLEKLKDICFLLITGIFVASVAFLVSYRFHKYNGFVLKQQQALIESEQKAFAGIFAANIAHDATNTLTSLKFCVELLLRENELNTKSQELIHTMKQALRNLTDLNQKLMESSKKGIQGEKTYGNLNSEIEKTLRVASINPRLEHCSIDFQSNTPSINLDMNILLINEMILNLLLNAGDAIEQDSGEIILKLDHIGTYAVIEIHDNGPGVPENIREKIFDVFYTTKKSGSGLGLLTVKACAEFHQGWVEVSRSPLLKGALFRIWFPISSQSIPTHPQYTSAQHLSLH